MFQSYVDQKIRIALLTNLQDYKDVMLRGNSSAPSCKTYEDIRLRPGAFDVSQQAKIFFIVFNVA